MISVVVLTKNEEKNIVDCLESVSWADEIIIVDDFSEDRTIEIINALSFSPKVKVFKKRLENDFSSQRNFALLKCKHEWIIFIDADERVSKELREEINSVIIDEKNKEINKGFYIRRKDVLFDKLLKHGEVGNIKLLRMARKDSGKWEGKVHEDWKIDGKVSELENYITHYPHQELSEFLREINFYSSIKANELYEAKVKVSALDVVIYPKGKFFVNYILKLGFLDGIEGLILAIVMSMHSFLVRSKLWLLWQKN